MPIQVDQQVLQVTNHQSCFKDESGLKEVCIG